MGFLLRSEFVNENRGEARSSKQCNDQLTDQTVFLVAPIITDFIRNTQRELYDEKLEHALEMLKLEWSKDDDTKTQCNRLNTSPLDRGNASNTNGPARVKRRMQWKAPSKPLAVDDPLLLLERAVPVEICITWFLDPDIPSHPRGGYVRILEESLRWEERLGKTRIKPTDGLPMCRWLSRTEGGNSRAAVGTFYENDCWTENKSRSQSSRRKLSARKKRKKQGIDHQHGQYYEHCQRSTKPRDSKAKR